MRLTTKIEYTLPQATREAIDILTEESNQLVKYREGPDKILSHRASIAIEREILRLRAIATALEATVEPEPYSQHD